MSDEIAVARLVRERYGLNTLPVPIGDVLGDRADVEYDSIPNGVDGLVVDLHSTVRARPLVIIHEDRPRSRQRFTMAHELGHLCLSWHLGVMGCHVSLGPDEHTDSGREEGEANRFASEILIPSDYLRAVHATGATLDQALVQVADEAEVSGIASVIAASKMYEPGWVWCCVDPSAETVVHAGTSQRTSLRLLKRGSKFDWDHLNQAAEHRASVSVGMYRYEIAHLPTDVDECVRPDGDLPKLYKKLLREIGSEVSADGDELLRLKFVIGGEVSAANQAHQGASASEMYATLMTRFAGRSDLAEFVEHDKWELFLAARAHDLIDRRA